MPLKLRPTGLGSGIDKDRPDYAVYCGEWGIGRIYETRGGPDNLRWFWSLTIGPNDAFGPRRAPGRGEGSWKLPLGPVGCEGPSIRSPGP